MSIKLHPDLVPYLQTNNGIPGLFHPLVYSLFHHESMNERMNRYYEYKLQSLKAAKEKGDYDTYVFLYERPHRISAFMDIMVKLSDPDYWRLLALVYTDSENIWQYKDALETLFGSTRPHSEAFMNADERAVLASLPDPVTIHRGYVVGNNARSFSYTLDPAKAQWFANRFEAGKVKTITVRKSDILGYKDCRNEREIVLRRSR